MHAVSSTVATAWWPESGQRARPSRAPEQPLELYSIESSSFARRVRELRCELELPYLLHNVGRTRLAESIPPAVRDRLGLRVPVESDRRKAFVARSGRMMVPDLVDPNAGVAMFETNEIRAHLRRTYGAARSGG